MSESEFAVVYVLLMYNYPLQVMREEIGRKVT
jgi:hypothetical protein